MRLLSGLMCAFFLLSLSLVPVQASSHADTVFLRRDPAMDQVSLYAFRSPEKEDRVVIAGTYFPFSSDRTDFFHALPDPDGLYAFHIDQDGDAMEDLTYAIRFRQLKDRQSQVWFGVEGENVKSEDENAVEGVEEFHGYPYKMSADIYVISGVFDGRVRRRDLVFRNLKVSLGAEGVVVHDKAEKGRFFFGHRDDPEFVGAGLSQMQFQSTDDQYAGMNVFAIAMELPLSTVKNDDSVVGIWGATYRTAVRQMKNGMTRSRGKWQQVSRVGMPWVTRLYLPYSAKHRYNVTHPSQDVSELGEYFLKPSLMSSLANMVGLEIPVKGRQDLYDIHLNGIPDVNQFRSGEPAEMLRLNLSLAPSERPSRMGALGGDFSGYPNGRRLSDDVTDISLQMMGGMLLSSFGIPFENTSQLLLFGDRVTSNDRGFLSAFPYLASPHL